MSIRHTALSALLPACLLLALTPAHADTDAQKLATVQEMIKAWNTLNWNKVYDLFAEDAVLHSVMLEPTVGREAIKKRISGLATGISRIELKVRNIGVINGTVFVERVDDFVYQGHAGKTPVVGVVEVDKGRIKVWREYYDRAQLLREMGLKEDFDKGKK